jgi:hypothetical protein
MAHPLTQVVLTSLRCRSDAGEGARVPSYESSVSLTLAKPTIPAEITPTRVLQLTGAFGAFANHCGHDGARDLGSVGALLFAEGARGIRMPFETPVGDHDAFGDCLFG